MIYFKVRHQWNKFKFSIVIQKQNHLREKQLEKLNPCFKSTLMKAYAIIENTISYQLIDIETSNRNWKYIFQTTVKLFVRLLTF